MEPGLSASRPAGERRLTPVGLVMLTRSCAWCTLVAAAMVCGGGVATRSGGARSPVAALPVATGVGIRSGDECEACDSVLPPVLVPQSAV